MKKYFVFISINIMLLLMVSCDNQEKRIFQPNEIGEVNVYYTDYSNKGKGEENPKIQVSKIDKNEKNISIKVKSESKEQFQYYFGKYISINILNEEGERIKYKEMYLRFNSKEPEITITGIENIELVKWVEILPFKTTTGDPLIFRL